jgi:hypothetical protein
MNIREVITSDAQAMLELFHKLDRESDYMLLEPNERQTTLEEQKGIGTALLSQALTKASKAGICRIELTVREDNTAASDSLRRPSHYSGNSFAGELKQRVLTIS